MLVAFDVDAVCGCKVLQVRGHFTFFSAYGKNQNAY